MLPHEPPTQPQQEREAELIYRALFHQTVPDGITRHFIDASNQLHSNATPQDVAQYYQAIQGITDLEALEVAGRYRRKLPLLSSKFRLMVYLAETLPENQPFFINTESRAVRGWLAVFRGAFRTAFKLGKGLYLLGKVKNG